MSVYESKKKKKNLFKYRLNLDLGGGSEGGRYSREKKINTYKKPREYHSSKTIQQHTDWTLLHINLSIFFCYCFIFSYSR